MKSGSSTGAYFPSRKLSLRKRAKLLKGRNITSLLVPLDELRAKDLRKDQQWPGTQQRIRTQNLSPTYKGISKDGTVYFETNSGTYGPSVKWRQRIVLLELRDAIKLQKGDPSMTNRDVVTLSVLGDIKTHCVCPAYIYYGWQYINWELGSGIEPEARFPAKRNPRLVGTGCKHIQAVLQTMPFHISEITRDLVRQGVLSKPVHYKRLKLDVEEPPKPRNTDLWNPTLT